MSILFSNDEKNEKNDWTLDIENTNPSGQRCGLNILITRESEDFLEKIGLYRDANICQHFSMKYILAPILLLVFLFPALAMGETMNDLVKRDGVFYKKFTDVPFTGKVTGQKQGNIKNGVREGPWVEYNEDGQLKGKGNYNVGVRHGPWIHYWSTGELQSKGTYKFGKWDGPWVGYFTNGQVLEPLTGNFKDGVKVE